MKRIISICTAPLLFLLLGANGPDKPRLAFTGLGSVLIGMAETDAQALGFQLTTQGPWGEVGDPEFVACHYLDSAPDYPGIALMVHNGEVVRIDIGFLSGAEDWQSHSGAKIGMSETAVAALYGDWLERTDHPYLDDAGSYLTLTSWSGRYAMTFETAVKDMSNEALADGNQTKYVTNFRAGLAGPVGYIEGCA